MAANDADHIRFLGTAGARFVMIRQDRSTAGVLYSLAGCRLLVDPGPGSLVHCLNSRPRIDPSTLDAILLTHGHLDHGGDVNVMIEAMTHGGHRPHGTLFAPRDALAGDPVVMRYVRDYLGDIQELAAGRSWALAPDLTLATPVRHLHGTETYGFRLETPTVRISHIADTDYFPELAEHYAPADLLVLHVVLYVVDPSRKHHILHLDVADATRLVADIQPRLAVITHFGTHVLEARPWDIAARMTDETGIRVLAAHDGMRLDLTDLPHPQAPQEGS